METVSYLMAYLNFDWDDVLPDHQVSLNAMDVLIESFGLGKVWYRISSSGTGMHVMIADLIPRSQEGYTLDLVPQDYEEAFVLRWRKHFLQLPFSLECQGRLNADRERSANGFRIGRIFKNKNGASAGVWKCYGLE